MSRGLISPVTPIPHKVKEIIHLDVDPLGGMISVVSTHSEGGKIRVSYSIESENMDKFIEDFSNRVAELKARYVKAEGGA